MPYEARPHILPEETLLLVGRGSAWETVEQSQNRLNHKLESLPSGSDKERRDTAARFGQMARRVFDGDLPLPIPLTTRDYTPGHWVKLAEDLAERVMNNGGAVVRVVPISEEGMLWDPGQASKK
jgi:hypothetical protein